MDTIQHSQPKETVHVNTRHTLIRSCFRTAKCSGDRGRGTEGVVSGQWLVSCMK
jgi:hypothetical protein